MDAVIHPFRTIGRVAGLGASVARLMAPAGKPLSPIMTGRSFRRHVEILDLDLPDDQRAPRRRGAAP